MSDRRSGRSSKKVNYAAFGAGNDDDFDEDFKDITPPPAKKAKTLKTSNKENTLKKQAIKNNEKENNKKRKPPNDRTFDRELQLALEMSMHESQDSTGGTDELPPPTIEASEPFSITASVEAMEGLNKLTVEATPPVLQPITADQPELVVLEEDEDERVTKVESVTPRVGQVFDDSIEVISSVPEVEPKTKRRATAKKPVVDSDSESAFDPDDDVEDLSDESDDDYEEDNDSDFEGFGKKKKGKGKSQKPAAKKQTTPKSKSTAKSKAKAPPVSKSVAPRSKVTAVRKSMSPSVGQTMSSPVGRSLGGGTPKWTPPGHAGKPSLGGASVKSHGTSLGGAGTKSPGLSSGAGRIKSPSSSLGGVHIKSPLSGLRLGLSRHQSVKPLHSGLKVKH